MSELFTIEAYNPVGQLKYRWKAELLSQIDKLVVFYGHWNRLLEQEAGDATEITNQSLEFYWADRAYMISAIFDSSAKLCEYYARMILPPRIDSSNRKLALTLIGPDLQISPELSYEVLDLPFQPTPEQQERFNLDQSWMDLIMLIERREGPFDTKFLSTFRKKIKKL